VAAGGTPRPARSCSRRLSIDFALAGGLELAAQLFDHSLEVFDRGQVLLERRRQLARDPVGGDADRLGDIPECILDYRAVAALAQQKTQGRPIGRRPDQVVGGRMIEVELAGILRLEFPRL
jgi:hypothetical protein